MKKLIFILICVLAFASCEKKQEFVPRNELPVWLKDIVDGYDLTIRQNPNTPNPVLAATSWIRYKWNNEYYFEHQVLTSSSFDYPISFNRDTLKVCPVCVGTAYNDNKCCGQYVWKCSVVGEN
jgi:hypothetical protein